MDIFGNNKIDDYLLGRLEGEELKAFEEQLKTDAAFAKTVADQKQSMDLIGKAGDLEMKLEVQEAQKKFNEENKPKSLFRRIRPFLAAAAVLLLLVVSYFLLQGPTNNDLFDNYYTAYNTGFGDRDENDSSGIKLAEASRFYRNKEYDKALKVFQSLTDFENAQLQLMTGICHLEIGEYDQANQFFTQLYNERDPAFQYHGLWYSALTYLKANDPEKAKEQLEQLIQADHPNGVFKQAEAKALLKKL